MTSTDLHFTSSLLDLIFDGGEDCFPRMSHITSPVPMGLTPEHLSNAIRQQATNAFGPFGSTYEEQILLKMLAKELMSSTYSSLNEVHKRLQPCASMLNEPAETSVQSAIV